MDCTTILLLLGLLNLVSISYVKGTTDTCSCQNGGKCVEVHSGLTFCQCPRGWSGVDCSLDVDECSLEPDICNNGVCSNIQGSIMCICNKGFTGIRCDIKVSAAKDTRGFFKRLIGFATPPPPATTVIFTTLSPPPFTTKAPPTPAGFKTPEPITEPTTTDYTTPSPPPIQAAVG